MNRFFSAHSKNFADAPKTLVQLVSYKDPTHWECRAYWESNMVALEALWVGKWAL